MARPLSDPKTPFGWRLRAVREAHGVNLADSDMNQTKFAELLGLGPMTYSHYEAGNRKPNLAVLARIQSRTNCDLNWLITGKERKTDPEIAPKKQPKREEPVGIKLHRELARRAQ